MLTEQFKNFALLGAEWVLWLLVLLSILSVGVMIERFMFLRARKVDLDGLAKAIRKALRDNDDAAIRKAYGDSLAMPALVALRGVEERERGIDAVAEAMNETKARAKKDHDRLLVVLGTLGNNAPFIGLFGTVLGIIKALFKLQEEQSKGAVSLPHGDLGQALVATAVGLLVALPAVIAFNYFNRRNRRISTSADEMAHVVLGELHAEADAAEKDAA